MALTGNETLQVLSQDNTGRPAAGTETVTTAQIAALASSNSTSPVITTISTVGAGTLTAAAIVGRIISRTGTQTGAFTDTTDTAAAIITAMGASAIVGDTFEMTYINNTVGGFTATITNGANVTVTGTATVPQNTWSKFLVTYNGTGTVTLVQTTSGEVPNTAVGETIGAVCTSGFTATSNTVLANVVGMTLNLVAGATYIIEAYFSCSSAATPGIKISLGAGGTATATSLLLDTWGFNTTTTTAQANSTSFAGNQIAAAVVTTAVTMNGTLVVNAGGTLQVQAAQDVSNATSTTIAVGSFITATRIA